MTLAPVLIIYFALCCPLLLISQEDGSAIGSANQAEKTVVSDREKLELVKDSNVAEAVNRRPDLNFRNVTIDGEVAKVPLRNALLRESLVEHTLR